MVVWMFVGIYLGPQVIPTRTHREAQFRSVLRLLATGEVEAAEQKLEQGMTIGNNCRHKAAAHSHGLCYALLMVICGLVLRFCGLSRTKLQLATWALIIGSVLQPVGVLMEIVHQSIGEITTAIGACLLILGVGGFFMGLFRFVDSR